MAVRAELRMVAIRARGKAAAGNPAQNGAGVVPSAACWWQMVRGGAASLVMEAKSARGVTLDRMVTGLLPLPKRLVTICCNRAAFSVRAVVAPPVAAD